MRNLRRIMSCIVAGALCLSLAACAGDGGNTEEAKLDRATEALNNGNPDAAIAELAPAELENFIDSANAGDTTGLDTFTSANPEATEVLASAYIQQAGFDTLELVSAFADNQDSTTSDTSVIFKATSDIFGVDDNGKIPEIDKKLTSMNRSATLLSSLIATSVTVQGGAAKAVVKAGDTDKVADLKTLLGLVSAIDLVVLSFHITDLQFDYVTGKFTYSNIDRDKWDYWSYRIIQDLWNIRVAANALADAFNVDIDEDKTDIQAEFDGWLVEIGYATEIDGVISYDTLTYEELDAYLKTLL